MLAKTHLAFAVFVFGLLFNFFKEPFIVGAFILLATIFVDIDSKKSTFGNYWLFRPIQWLFSHRGIIHSLLFALVISLAIFLFNVSAGLGFFIGYVLHLLLDCFTPSGICFFYPFCFKFRGFVKSGGIFEDVLFVFLLVADIVIFWRLVFQFL
jgi:membrane-bound metal-dependent hydrolase YbcI (DUF457 family)